MIFLFQLRYKLAIILLLKPGNLYPEVSMTRQLTLYMDGSERLGMC